MGGDLAETDRKMLTIYSRVFDTTWLDDLRQLLADEPQSPVDVEFDQRPADADEATRQRIAEGLATALRRQAQDHSMLSDFRAYASRSPAEAESAVMAALRELYNPAQLDVLHRANLVLQDDADHQDRSDEGIRP